MFTKKESDPKKTEAQQKNNQKYSKAQFAESRQLSRIEKDILAAVLLEKQTYTIEEAQEHIQQFMNGEAQ
ncbi:MULTISPECIES: hypothetical protein [Paenibacillus]|uniref:YqzN/YkzM domain-containing protein n=1 Tax=Paenibacillus amylolyticus TaxID=1451 RepID=A0ABD8AXW3_PAEAM|nr:MULTISPECIES: hypothetical protein [Paenibacillus]ETT50436.1 hypothetical protein C170_15840 [Paenibacillus sp. FSL H7-689]OME97475.1 hypothetical protein BK124_15870 [Paenibacillus amylolyticus]